MTHIDSPRAVLAAAKLRTNMPASWLQASLYLHLRIDEPCHARLRQARPSADLRGFRSKVVHFTRAQKAQKGPTLATAVCDVSAAEAQGPGGVSGSKSASCTESRSSELSNSASLRRDPVSDRQLTSHGPAVSPIWKSRIKSWAKVGRAPAEAVPVNCCLSHCQS